MGKRKVKAQRNGGVTIASHRPGMKGKLEITGSRAGLRQGRSNAVASGQVSLSSFCWASAQRDGRLELAQLGGSRQRLEEVAAGWSGEENEGDLFGSGVDPEVGDDQVECGGG